MSWRPGQQCAKFRVEVSVVVNEESASVPRVGAGADSPLFIFIPQVIFSEAIIALKDWPTQILAAVFPTRRALLRWF